MTKCKFCGSGRTIKYGKSNGKQAYECKDCGHTFVDNGSLLKMRTPTQAIVTALDMYYEGLSLRKVQRQLLKLFKVRISQVSVWEWLMKYGKLVKEYVNTLQAQKLGGDFYADETEIKSKGVDKWFWECIDKDTKFMVASHISEVRTSKDATILFEQARQRSVPRPHDISTDGLYAYRKGFNRVFYSRYKTDRINFMQVPDYRFISPVERLHQSLKDRTVVMRGVGANIITSENLLGGWDAHYNFIRPHQSLGGKTPSQVAGVPVEIGDWENLILNATYYKTVNKKKDATLSDFFRLPRIT